MRKSVQPTTKRAQRKPQSIQSGKVQEAKTGELITKDEARALLAAQGKLPAAFQARIGAGRPKGVQNKLTRKVRDIIFKCFDDIGGAKAFADWAKKNPTEFYRAFAKLVPQDKHQVNPNDAKYTFIITPKDAAL